MYVEILAEANRIVTLDRGSAYGHPFDDFSRTGKMWAAILGLDEVKPEQVAMCMIALKLSRECNKPGRDNRVDIAGYVKTLDMVVEKRSTETSSRDGSTSGKLVSSAALTHSVDPKQKGTKTVRIGAPRSPFVSEVEVNDKPYQES